jgi:hypothetical protein
MAEVWFRTKVEDFSSNLCVQTGSGAHPASCTVGAGGSFPGVKRGRGVMLTTHPLLVPRLRKSRIYTSCHPNAPLWSVTGPLYLFTFSHVCYRSLWNNAFLATFLAAFKNFSIFGVTSRMGDQPFLRTIQHTADSTPRCLEWAFTSCCQWSNDSNPRFRQLGIVATGVKSL